MIALVVVPSQPLSGELAGTSSRFEGPPAQSRPRGLTPRHPLRVMTREWLREPTVSEALRVGPGEAHDPSCPAPKPYAVEGWLIVSNLADTYTLPTANHRYLGNRDNPIDTLAFATSALEDLELARPRLVAVDFDDLCGELDRLLRHERSQQRMGLITIVATLCLATAAIVLSMHPAAVPPMTSTDELGLLGEASRSP